MPYVYPLQILVISNHHASRITLVISALLNQQRQAKTSH
jgi:hypothetical protein